MDREDAGFIGLLVGCAVGVYGMMLVLVPQKTIRKTNQFIANIDGTLLNQEFLISAISEVLVGVAAAVVWFSAMLLFMYVAIKIHERTTGWKSN